MKFISLLMWVGQFGLSAIFPTVCFLLAAVWLRSRFGLGMWLVVVFGILGILTSVSSARSCLRSMRKAAEEAAGKKQHPVSFNDHH